MVQQSGNGSRPRVLIAGGGVAALEGALALRDLAEGRIEVELHAPRREFLYRPFAVGEPYGAASILRYDLERLAQRSGASFHLGGIVSVDGARRRAMTRDGREVAYDYLLVATGARMLWAVPGAVTFWGVADEGGVGGVVRKLRTGELRNVVFTMPSGSTWALPAYELALLASAVLARSGVEDGRLIVVTPEDVPLQIFGRRVGEQMTQLLEERGIEVISGTHPVKFEDGRLRVAPGRPIETDAVISLPRLEGRRIGGIPHDVDGFVAVDEHGGVIGMERVFAAGDITAFPVKQGGIAAQLADVAARSIAREAGCDVAPAAFEPVLRGVLWTGADPRYLYGYLAGGHGETSTLSPSPPWHDQEGKIVGRYLAPFLSSVLDEDHRSLVSSPPARS
ncbi:MAG: FAD-dependent oxidoreductase [Solirubrobacterales bacterium]